MKKILVAILLLTYTFAASGASVELHYCMGKLIGWEFDYTSKHNCSNCGMPVKDKKGCCDNKQIQSKIDKDQQASFNNISLATDLVSTAPVYAVVDDAVIILKAAAHTSIHAPPLINRNPAYLLNRNFRI